MDILAMHLHIRIPSELDFLMQRLTVAHIILRMSQIAVWLYQTQIIQPGVALFAYRVSLYTTAMAKMKD